jgi:hypothetical protein
MLVHKSSNECTKMMTDLILFHVFWLAQLMVGGGARLIAWTTLTLTAPGLFLMITAALFDDDARVVIISDT